jgi:hypothetical protein
MNTKEKTHLKEKDTETKHKKFGDTLVAFLKNNKAATVLSILLLTVFIWLSVKLHLNEKSFINEKKQLITQHESTMDSLQINHLQFATKVFSWSVRSELLRNNTENLNQLLTLFIRESGADLVQIINPEDKTVLLSSDKKYEGNSYSGNFNFNVNNTVVLEEGTDVIIITPVMGFNKKIGVLIVKVRKK